MKTAYVKIEKKKSFEINTEQSGPNLWLATADPDVKGIRFGSVIIPPPLLFQM
jgi:hypothetical protein